MRSGGVKEVGSASGRAGRRRRGSSLDPSARGDRVDCGATAALLRWPVPGRRSAARRLRPLIGPVPGRRSPARPTDPRQVGPRRVTGCARLGRLSPRLSVRRLRSQHFEDSLDVDDYDELTFRVLGDGNRYIASLRTENWVVGDDACDDVWQAFLFARCADGGRLREGGGASGPTAIRWWDHSGSSWDFPPRSESSRLRRAHFGPLPASLPPPSSHAPVSPRPFAGLVSGATSRSRSRASR